MLTQQVRDEDMSRVRAVYDKLKIKAELAPFFSDLPARLASSQLVISRSGAGTVAELGAIGRPSILVPLPGALDQDQFANAGVLADAGGALRIAQGDFTPDRLAAEISALAGEPSRLTAMASGARKVGKLDAAERLADLGCQGREDLGHRFCYTSSPRGSPGDNERRVSFQYSDDAPRDRAGCAQGVRRFCNHRFHPADSGWRLRVHWSTG